MYNCYGNIDYILMKQKKFKFIDLFAGIGGFHMAFSNLGAECVFVNEFNLNARKTYEYNYIKKNKELFSDKKREPYFWKSIKEITLSDTNASDSVWKKNIVNIIPEFDILCAGFPCQPFSNIGKKRGLEDSRGTLFNDIERIIIARKPKVVFLENVRSILTHDGGKTFDYILNKLDKAGYHVDKEKDDSWNILKASDFGLPTHRQRFYLVAFEKNNGNAFKFKFPKPTHVGGVTLSKYFKSLNKNWDKCEITRDGWPDCIGRTLRVGGVGSAYKSMEWVVKNNKTPESYVKVNEDKVWVNDKRTWDSYMFFETDKDSSKRKKPHKISIDEAKAIMGFPYDFKFPEEIVSSSQRMKQLGNSVAIPVIQAIASQIIKTLQI
jgi:DNA (cytosine-5)-methyltransferase 1